MLKAIVEFMKASVHSSMLLMGTLIFGDPVLTDKLSTIVTVPYRIRIQNLDAANESNLCTLNSKCFASILLI